MADELIALLKQLDIIYREKVNLKNAGASDFYVDVKKAYGYPGALSLIADALYDKMDKRATCIATAGYGGMPAAAVISARYDLDLILVRDVPKKHGKGGAIDGYIPTEVDRVAIVDDVFTTGGSLKKMIEALEPTGAKVVGCYVVCKRGEGSLSVPVEYLLTPEELI